MVYIKQIGFSEINYLNKDVIVNFENKIAVGEVEKEDFLYQEIFPLRTFAFNFMLVEEGSLHLELDYTSYLLEKDSFILVLPEHVVQNMVSSTDLRMKLLIIDQEYFSSIGLNRNKIYEPTFFNVRKFPCMQLSGQDVDTLNLCLGRIREKITQDHHFKDEMIKTLFTEFLLEVENIFVERNHNTGHSKLSSQEKLLHNFFQLLQENGIYEHTVFFYADKLSVTTQYLALVLKQLTGKSTKEWIADSLTVEAKILLKHSSQSVQQISDALNFCDASAFGKFFKNRTGVTPFRFRQKNLIFY
ncbi:MAG: helix-turn-helix domain-containing protein [Dysgonomonas sp.]|nr:helix-turn-helix domain-containing protein [Dysgonomonas sp.]